MISKSLTQDGSHRRFIGGLSEVEDQMSFHSLSTSYSNSIDRFNGNQKLNEGSVQNFEDMTLVKVQLTETMEENSLIKSRLHMELKERHMLEIRNRELTDKLNEARRGLQDTGAALFQLQQATDQLMAKRDQREIQLQNALETNRLNEEKIIDLETKLTVAEDKVKLQSSIKNYRKMLVEKDELIRQLEDQQLHSQNQISKTKRENYLLLEEKKDLESILDSRQKRIAMLESTVMTLSDENHQAQLALKEQYKASQSPLKEELSKLNSLSFDGQKTDEMKLIDEKIANFHKEKKVLEDRMNSFESQLYGSNVKDEGEFATPQPAIRTPSKPNSAKSTTRNSGSPRVAPIKRPDAVNPMNSYPFPQPLEPAHIQQLQFMFLQQQLQQQQFFQMNPISFDALQVNSPFPMQTNKLPSNNQVNNNNITTSSSDVNPSQPSSSTSVRISDDENSKRTTEKPVRSRSSTGRSKRRPTDRPSFDRLSAQSSLREENFDVDESSSSPIKLTVNGSPPKILRVNTSSGLTLDNDGSSTKSREMPATSIDSIAVDPVPADLTVVNNVSAEVQELLTIKMSNRSAFGQEKEVGETPFADSNGYIVESVGNNQVKGFDESTLPSFAATPTHFANGSEFNADLFVTMTAPASAGSDGEVDFNRILDDSMLMESSVDDLKPSTAPIAPVEPVPNETNEERKGRLLKEKKVLKKKIYNWTKSFMAENNGREPTKQERELYAKDMYKSYKINAKALRECDIIASANAKNVAKTANTTDVV